MKKLQIKKKKNNVKFRCECKNCCTCQKDCSFNPNTCICENDKYLVTIADTSVSPCDEIKHVMNIVSTNAANTISTNVTSTASIIFDDKKRRYKMD